MNKIYDWDNAPVWASWAARDSNGFAHWFEKLPFPAIEGKFSVEWLHQKNTLVDSSCNPFWIDTADSPEALLSLEHRSDIQFYDPLYPLVGKEIYVCRKDDNVFVSIFRNKIDNTYSFINLTKNHVCTCKFESVADALYDLDEQVWKKNGKVVHWQFLPEKIR